MTNTEKHSANVIISQSTIEEILHLLNDNYLPEEIAKFLSVDIKCVRFIAHERARN
jgi:hypothetical protein